MSAIAEDPGQPAESIAEGLRLALPELLKRYAQVVIDNPRPFAIVAAASIVAARLGVRAMRPRTAAEAAALFVVVQFGLTEATRRAMIAGVLRFKVRDESGRLVPLEVGRDAGNRATP